MTHECHGCGDPATHRCSGCKVARAWYCSQKCQRELWPVHIFECNPRQPINTAYYLARACRRDRLPDDPQTCEDYGFTKAFTVENRCKLLGLYIGLTIYQDVSPSTLHKWRIKGKLVEGIKEVYEKVPAASRGKYYPWFLENQYILDPSKIAPTDHVHETFMRAWRYAGGLPTSSLEEMMETVGTWPEKKQACFQLCLCLLSGWHPSPDQLLWVQFGFCVSPDEWHETSVSQIYQALIARCTFNEFYTAYQSSALIPLFHAKGLGSELRSIPHIEDVLECCLGHKSVWDLKQYVVVDAAELIPSVAVDYGFVNCKTEEEIDGLKKVYKTFFGLPDADPIELHEAAIKGRLFEYVGALVKLKKRFYRLMKNPYPLTIM